MFRQILAAIALVILLFAAPALAQQPRAAYGPVVRAYLIGLDEELAELEFQFKHREISRSIYDRTKQRLAILRRYVERVAAKNPEDRVPEFHVLADDELSILRLGVELNPDELRPGEDLGGEWRLASVERARERFFVLERLRQNNDGRLLPERKPIRELDPLDVIETLLVREETSEPKQPSAVATAAQPVATQTEHAGSATLVTNTQPAAPKQQTQIPRLLHVYLPEYTSKAREKKIEGELIVRALLQSDGKIKKVKVEKGLGYGLDQRAVEAVKRLGFLPAERDGIPVDSTAQIVFSFRLEKVTLTMAETELSKVGKL